MPYADDLRAFDAPQRDPGGDVVARLAQALASERGNEPPNPLEGAMGQSRQYFPALAAMSGTQQAPPPAQFEPGDHLRRNMPTPRRVGIGESISDALLPRRDDQGMPQPAGIRDAINAALWVLPGMRGPRGAVMAAEKGAGSGGELPRLGGALDGVPVADHAANLRAALGKDEFQASIDALKADKAITQKEAVDLASQFYEMSRPFAASTSRSKAFNLIQERHDRLMKFRSESERTGIGRRSAS